MLLPCIFGIRDTHACHILPRFGHIISKAGCGHLTKQATLAATRCPFLSCSVHACSFGIWHKNQEQHESSYLPALEALARFYTVRQG
jgi:hypothetical protein